MENRESDATVALAHRSVQLAGGGAPPKPLRVQREPCWVNKTHENLNSMLRVAFVCEVLAGLRSKPPRCGHETAAWCGLEPGVRKQAATSGPELRSGDGLAGAALDWRQETTCLEKPWAAVRRQPVWSGPELRSGDNLLGRRWLGVRRQPFWSGNAWRSGDNLPGAATGCGQETTCLKRQWIGARRRQVWRSPGLQSGDNLSGAALGCGQETTCLKRPCIGVRRRPGWSGRELRSRDNLPEVALAWRQAATCL